MEVSIDYVKARNCLGGDIDGWGRPRKEDARMGQKCKNELHYREEYRGNILPKDSHACCHPRSSAYFGRASSFTIAERSDEGWRTGEYPFKQDLDCEMHTVGTRTYFITSLGFRFVWGAVFQDKTFELVESCDKVNNADEAKGASGTNNTKERRFRVKGNGHILDDSRCYGGSCGQIGFDWRLPSEVSWENLVKNPEILEEPSEEYSDPSRELTLPTRVGERFSFSITDDYEPKELEDYGLVLPRGSDDRKTIEALGYKVPRMSLRKLIQDTMIKTRVVNLFINIYQSMI